MQSKQKNMDEIYYIVENGSSRGPYSIEGLRLLGINKGTFVWRQGMSDWKQAGDMPELAEVFAPADSAFGAYAEKEPEQYFAMFGDTRYGPASIPKLLSQGLTPDTPVWRNGMADWQPASSQPEIMEIISRNNVSRSVPPQMPTMAPGQQYHNGQQFRGVTPHTNWMPWAIVGTVLGFLCSCIGGIIGIVAITKASQANTFYNQGDDYQGQNANNSAQTWTIVSLVLAGIGIIISLLQFSTIIALLP